MLRLNLKLPLIILLCLMVCSHASAQQRRTWEKYLDELTIADDNDIASSEDMFDVLSELEDSPIDINTATREDLSRIPFLSAQQIEDIEAYVYRSKGMKSLGELAMIESLDATRRQLLSFFVYVGDNKEKNKFPSLKNIFKYGKNEILATGHIPFYERKGDHSSYLGPQYRHSFRYEFSYGKYLKLGIQGAQDAGEPFFKDKNTMGYDHYSYYLLLRDLGRIKTLAIGQYKIRLGMGLVINTDFGFGKLMTLSSLGRSSNSIRANTSRSAANYMQGAAITINIVKNIDLTAFASYRPIDATLNDSGNIQTIVKTGYHRTKTEMAKKNNASEMAAGGSFRWKRNRLHIGVNAIFSSLSKELQPNKKQEYRKYYPSGKAFWNTSIDYGYISHRLTVNGETATGKGGGIATINSVSYLVGSDLSLIALQRYYSKKYSSLFSSSFSDGGRVQNEAGFYFGANWQALSSLNIMFYSDYAYFPSPKYQASRPSHSWENAVTLTFTRNAWTVLGRYRLKIRQKDSKYKTRLVDDQTQRGRLLLGYTATKWSARLQADMSYNSYKEESFGWMTSATGTYDIWKLKFVATMGYFKTDSYASRIYTYERGPLRNFYFPAFYGEGIRYALFIRGDVNKSIMLIAKCGTTDYFDRNHISSGLQQIDGSSQSDMEVQLRWKF